MASEHAVLAIAFHQNNEGELFIPLVIAINRKQGKWKLPGGCQESDETLKESTFRELLQETGLFGKNDTFIKVGKLNKSTPGNKHAQHCYVTEVLNTETLYTEPVWDGDELLEVKMFSVSQLCRALSSGAKENDPIILEPHAVFLRYIFKKMFT